jgi:hypothetical protein
MYTDLDSELIAEHIEEMELEYVLPLDEIKLDELAHFEGLLEVLGKIFSLFHHRFINQFSFSFSYASNE